MANPNPALARASPQERPSPDGGLATTPDFRLPWRPPTRRVTRRQSKGIWRVIGAVGPTPRADALAAAGCRAVDAAHTFSRVRHLRSRLPPRRRIARRHAS